VSWNPLRRLNLLAPLAILFASALAAEAEGPQPTLGAKPPEGAVVLFDGTDASKWKGGRVEEGCLREGPTTKDSFGSAQIHLEFSIQPLPDGKRPHGNSGVYIQRRYEIQVLNSAGQPPSKGGCAAIYQFKPPDTNASLPPGEWQSVDITFHQPRWDGDTKVKNARITVVHNGVKVQDDVEVPRKTGSGQKEGPEPGPLFLQNHGAKVLYRNIWLLPLRDDEGAPKAAETR